MSPLSEVVLATYPSCGMHFTVKYIVGPRNFSAAFIAPLSEVDKN